MLTDNELTVLSHIRENARTSVAKIGAKANMPATTVFANLKKLEDKKIIRKYTCFLDYQKLKMFVRVNFAVKAGKKSELLNFLLEHPNINSVSRVGREHDFYFETIFPDMAVLYKFIESLDQFEPTLIHEHYIIEDIVREQLFSQ